MFRYKSCRYIHPVYSWSYVLFVKPSRYDRWNRDIFHWYTNIPHIQGEIETANQIKRDLLQMWKHQHILTWWGTTCSHMTLQCWYLRWQQRDQRKTTKIFETQHFPLIPPPDPRCLLCQGSSNLPSCPGILCGPKKRSPKMYPESPPKRLKNDPGDDP